MSIILNIDTATETAGISISKDGDTVESITNSVQKDHAAFLHPAVSRLVRSCGIQMRELDAIAVTAGPGSYTGLRVGMASAKGFCAALNKPLITINTLELLAKDAIMHNRYEAGALFCPMIDARRMEVYTAIYDQTLKELVKPAAMILDENSYADLTNCTVINFGSGANKWKSVVKLRNYLFIENVNIPVAMASLTNERYIAKSFTDLVYSEPLYLKEFYNGA